MSLFGLDPFRTLSEEEELQHSYQDLMQQLKEEKRRWLEFDQLLKQALQDDNDFQTN